jgi:nitroimidazol reductase NimA-like FMN-containing flavoprotein (pyridoxamine 5'-phosphate oxidase superfamily)
MVIIEMDRAACMALLQTSRIGRLACARDGQPYVVPISFAAEGNHLYGFSLLGRKIDWMRGNAKVCVQVDELENTRNWRSVVINGRYEELPDRIGTKVQRDRAWSLLSKHAQWWEPGGLKPVAEAPTPHLFYRISIDEISGRQARPVN